MYLEYTELNEIKVNASTVILTENDGRGWYFEKGECVVFDYTKHSLEFDDEYEYLCVGLMKNDMFYTGYMVKPDIDVIEITIPEYGLYSLCMYVEEK